MSRGSDAPIPALVNPLAGGAASARKAILADPRFEARDIAAQQLGAAVRAEAERGTSRVLVCGGDGTLRTAIGAAAGTALEIAVLPGGTLNHFARDLGLPLDDPVAALEIAATGVAAPVDLGYVNGHAMLNTSSVGTYVDFVLKRRARERWLGYRLASIVAAIGVWFDPRAVFVDFQSNDGVHHRLTTPLLFIGVEERILGHAGLGMRQQGGAHALHVLIVKKSTRPGVAALAFGAVARGLDGFVRTDQIETHLVTRATVVMRHRSGRIAVDGEIIRVKSPLHYRFTRDAAKVVRRAQ